MNKLNNSILAGIAAAGIATSVSPFFRQAIEENAKWEQRQIRWEMKWGGSEDVSELYRRLADVAMAYGFNDLTNVQPWFLTEDRGKLTLKMVAEELVGYSLPDINPKKCFEFAKGTPISAEIWCLGCTDYNE
jgi:hypothetical protein